MVRGNNWSESESALLSAMIQRGMSVQQIYGSCMFPNRTYRAIENVARRESSELKAQRNVDLGTRIGEAEIVGLDSVVKRYVDAFNKICDLNSCKKEDLERFRIIFASARVYFDIYYKFQKFDEVEKRVERVEKLVAQLAEKKNTEDPQAKPGPNGDTGSQPPV